MLPGDVRSGEPEAETARLWPLSGGRSTVEHPAVVPAHGFPDSARNQGPNVQVAALASRVFTRPAWARPPC